ncbi:NADH:flavin oxidoreductase/NADH oxidase [Futiania mangrovi]|uniref:NADH:flavin oxidoreductase/NADH oxidase n=1 Tax=Futiania mangrovi TaxID=2959716 RepID=A0A9J6PHH9_9PROT|nr:NADH:flavin oxidoreductase/NADH oxidase [Futiania mangrovii]MCP1337259.1 NADH:flavin oxidoreductase/NADH oxidase [Futiania mangrovii]
MTYETSAPASPVFGTGSPTGRRLFRPISFRSVTARNRVMMSPMCQYSATDGMPNDWHYVHLGARATGGCGIVCVEATHVEARGRITPGCLGLWNDPQRDELGRIVAFLKSQGATPAIQLAHAGRKASCHVPWDGGLPLGPDEGAWTTVAPSAVPYADGHPVPEEMSKAMIAEVIQAFVDSTRRSLEAGFEILELHSAHGYLGHSFLSPLSNRRTDEYGIRSDGGTRFLMELIDAVRGVWPEELPLFVRLSCDDWADGGFTIDDAVMVAKKLKARGDVDLVDCSGGGMSPDQKIPVFPGYQVPFAERIRREAGIATGAVGLIKVPELAEAILAQGQADLILVGRALLVDPNWTFSAARALGAKDVTVPPQYLRGGF